MNTQSFLISGMLDEHTEFFDHDRVMRKVESGQCQSIAELPERFAELIDDHLSGDHRAAKWLQKAGFTTREAMRMKFYQCNYSTCDNKPDMTACGSLGEREYVPCSERGTCTGENVVCRIPGGLTPRQRDVIQQIGEGLLDKEICDLLNISLDTLRSHKDHISAKTGEVRKPALGVVAHKLNLI